MLGLGLDVGIEVLSDMVEEIVFACQEEGYKTIVNIVNFMANGTVSARMKHKCETVVKKKLVRLSQECVEGSKKE